MVAMLRKCRVRLRLDKSPVWVILIVCSYYGGLQITTSQFKFDHYLVGMYLLSYIYGRLLLI